MSTTKTFHIFGVFDETLLTNVGSDFLEAAHGLSGGFGVVPRINVFIYSPGGYTAVLRTFLDGMEVAKARGVEVATFVTGDAFSCGSMLAVAGTKGLRFMSPTARHLLHYGWTSAQGTNPTEFDRDSDASQRHFEFVVEHYRRNSSVPKLRKKLRADMLYVGLDQALDWGLADRPMF